MAENMAVSSSSARVTCTPVNFLYSPEVAEETEVSKENEISRKERKRKLNPENLGKKHVKRPGLRRNSPSVTITDQMECCKKKCLQTISISRLQKIRSNFESLMYEEQNIYLNGLLHRRETKKSSGHPRKCNPSTSSNGKRVGRPPAEDSMFSFNYSLRNDKGVDIRVCQKSFCNVHGFSPKRLLILRRKLGTGELQPDRRGKHGNHQSVDEEAKDLVRNHIETYPTRRSHYSRKDNMERVYLPPELSIARLHNEFLKKYDPEYIQLKEENRKHLIANEPVPKLRKPLVTEHMYHDIFVTEFNIHFGYPRTDSCSTCDNLTVQIEASGGRPAADELQKTLQAHQQLAQEGYSAFKYDRELSNKTWVIHAKDTE